MTKSILEEAFDQGYKHVLLQPGTYDEDVDEMLKDEKWQDMNIVKGCILIELGFDGH